MEENEVDRMEEIEQLSEGIKKYGTADIANRYFMTIRTAHPPVSIFTLENLLLAAYWAGADYQKDKLN